MQEKVAGLRRFGAAALDLAWVAAGRFDAYWERSLSPWDMAAGIALVREAGGFVTDLEGREAMLAMGGLIAGNEAIHRDLLRTIRQVANAELRNASCCIAGLDRQSIISQKRRLLADGPAGQARG